jgi:hypothetical protein
MTTIAEAKAPLEQAARIRLLLMDVDGVLTDGRLFNVPGPDGKMVETKGFDSQDGIALQWLEWYGIHTGVISGRVSPATEERARQVKMTYVYQGHIEKIPILEEIVQSSGIPSEQIAYRRRSHGRRGDAPRRPRHRARQRPPGGEARRALHHRRLRRARSDSRSRGAAFARAWPLGRSPEKI